MSAKLLEGKSVAESFKAKIKAEVEGLKAKTGRVPKLVALQIGEATQIMAHKKKKKMRLYSVSVAKDDPMKFLQVECPSTGTNYYLAVPPTAKKCQEALQWTYGRGRTFRKQLKFVEET